jgi:hypothetical protein
MNSRRKFIRTAAGLVVLPAAARVTRAQRMLLNPYRYSTASISSPLDITSATLKLWLDANDTSKLWQNTIATIAVSADSDPVRLWQDKSGASNHGTAPFDVARPLYKTGIQNGKAALLFDGTSDYFNIVDGFSALTAAEVFIVCKRIADPASSSGKAGFWAFQSNSAGVSQGAHVPWTDGVIYESFATTARKTVGNPTPAMTTTRLYNVISTSSEYTANLDTTQLSTTGTNTVGITTTPLVGASSDASGTSYFFDGYIMLVLIYNGKLSSGDRSLLTQWIKTEWGLTGY